MGELRVGMRIGGIELFDTRAAARYCGLKIETVKYHLYQSKKLEPDLRLPNGTLLFTRETLDRFQQRPGRWRQPAKDIQVDKT